MVDPILEALRAHTKEPEEVDWEAEFQMAEDSANYWCENAEHLLKSFNAVKTDNTYLRAELNRIMEAIAHVKSMESVHIAVPSSESAEIERLKNVILRLEQRCATLEGQNTELEQHRLALKDRYQAEHGLVSCNDCGKLLYRSAKDLHKCEGQGDG